MSQFPSEQRSPGQAHVGAEGNGLGLAGFIVSLVGLVACAGIISPIGMIMSAFAMKREPRGFAIAGLVLGIIGSIGMFVLVFVIGIGAVLAAVGLGAAFYMAQTTGEGIQIGHAIERQIQAGGPAPTTLDEVQNLDPKMKTDRWGRAYRFEMAADKKSFKLTSDGPDGVAGNDDDIHTEVELD